MSGNDNHDGENDTRIWMIRGVEPEIQEAARLAARQSGQTLSEWLSRTIGAVALSELGGMAEDEEAAALASDGDLADFRVLVDERTQDYLARSGASARAAVADPAEEPMTAVVELREPVASTGLTPELREEFDRIHLLIHEYMGAVLPALESFDEASRNLRDLSGVTQDVRRSSEDARRAAELIGPLERTLRRFADARGPEIAEDRNERRTAGIGKLLRG